MKPIALQLYTVRELAKDDFAGTVKQVGEIGYVGVEPAGLQGLSPQEAKALFDEAGVKVCSSHMGMPTEETVDDAVAQCRLLGNDVMVTGFGADKMESLDSVRECAAAFQKAAELMKPHGIKVAFHNHWWEFDRQFDGKTPYQILMDEAPDLHSELDVYWCRYGGVDPVETIKQYGSRIPLLHVKDGPLTGDDGPDPHTAVGKGKMDMPAIIGAIDPDACQWLIVELDHCADDMMTAVADSYRYLVGEGLAKGNK
ncbi:MAG: TIM barrel protein [Armatimonadia bacterium]|nr:TIM barrel protein [Armatimonadia bacterium]